MANEDNEDDGRLFPDLGSLRTVDRPIRVRFANCCPFAVDIFWMNVKKEPTKYGTLGQKQFLDIQTFEHHPWVARRAFDGCKVLVGKKPVYWPQPVVRNNQVRSVIVRQNILITFKVQSLKETVAFSLLHSPDIIKKHMRLLPRELQDYVKATVQIKDEYSSVVCRLFQPLPLPRP